MSEQLAIRARQTAVLAARFVPPRPVVRDEPALQVERNLIIVRQPGWQSLSDWAAITGHVRDIDPRMETFVVNATLPNSYTRRLAARRPTLVCSPGPLYAFRPARGKVFHGRPIPKVEQLRLLAAVGVSVPRTVTLTPELVLEPADWGEFVIVKPTDIATSSHGAGIQLMRTHRVRYISPADYPSGHPGRRGPMVVQQFIDTGPFISLFRVLTLFGEPLYSVQFMNREPRIDLGASDEDIESAVVATQALTAKETGFVVDNDVLAVARKAHAAIPDVPLKGCDVIREEATGRLFVLELNPGGNTWHFSSSINAERRSQRPPEHERERQRQFDAFRTAARVLVERTNAEAV